MRRLFVVALVFFCGCAGPMFGKPPNYGYRPEILLPYYLERFGEPDDWFRTKGADGRHYLSLTWYCTPGGIYRQTWFKRIRENPELRFGGAWMVDRHSTAAGICD